jgi:hypothetical protein
VPYSDRAIDGAMGTATSKIVMARQIDSIRFMAGSSVTDWGLHIYDVSMA